MIALGLVTGFIYFVIFNPESSGNWLAENMRLSWTILGIAMGSFGIFLVAKSNAQSSYHRIRGAVYSMIGASILVTVIFY